MNKNLDSKTMCDRLDAPMDRIRKDLPCAPPAQDLSPIDLQIFRLLSLYPDCGPQFRNNDLRKLDVNTKQTLLRDLKDAIGIRDFVFTGK